MSFSRYLEDTHTSKSTKGNSNFPTLWEYPYILKVDKNPKNHMFFQTEEQKQAFIAQTEGLEVDSPEFHRIKGHFLGFPEKSVNFFVKLREMELGGEPVEKMEKTRVGLYYAGISFQTHIDMKPNGYGKGITIQKQSNAPSRSE
ncbi:hypothetical protein [Thermoflavimicrobium dichotomicum]|nr:hypothetical protein [Thermoflavimicrobium dichotomicum]